jgi:DNA ligase-1
MNKTFPRLFKYSSGGASQQWEIRCNTNWNESSSYTVTYGQVDGKLQETTTIISEGKNIGKANETSPWEQALSEAESKWKKQKDKGYAETLIERSASKPMLAEKYQDFADRVTFPCYVQPKLDGIRCIATIVDGEVTLMSRGNKEFTTLDHIKQELKKLSPADGSVLILDGELYKHGTPFQKITSWVKREQEETYSVEYHVYDLVDTTKPFTDRLDVLDLLFQISIQSTAPIKLVDTEVALGAIDTWESFFLNKGYEGIMVRHGNCMYKAGGRSNELLKVKRFTDEEFTIVGAEEGIGRFEGMCTFVCETKAGDTFKCMPRGTEAERRAYWREKDKLIGKQLTVKFFEWTTGENPVPRFPIGITIRDYE